MVSIGHHLIISNAPPRTMPSLVCYCLQSIPILCLSVYLSMSTNVTFEYRGINAIISIIIVIIN